MTQGPRRVRIRLSNRSAQRLHVALEPRGNFGDLPPGASVEAVLGLSDSVVHLEVVLDDGRIAIWEEQGDTVLDPDRNGPGGDLWATAS